MRRFLETIGLLLSAIGAIVGLFFLRRQEQAQVFTEEDIQAELYEQQVQAHSQIQQANNELHEKENANVTNNVTADLINLANKR